MYDKILLVQRVEARIYAVCVLLWRGGVQINSVSARVQCGMGAGARRERGKGGREGKGRKPAACATNRPF